MEYHYLTRHRSVEKLFEEVFSEKKPLLNLSFVQDLEIMFNHFMQLGDNVQLSDKNFHKNFKFFFCSRSTKIKSYISIYNRIIVSRNIVVFSLEHVFKTSQNNYIHLSIKHSDPKLCISKCLKEYLQRREESFQCRKEGF